MYLKTFVMIELKFECLVGVLLTVCACSAHSTSKTSREYIVYINQDARV